MPEARRGDIAVTLDNHVAVVEIRRPPHNFFSHALIRDLADAFAELDGETDCRSILLCSEGKAFCAGADFAGDRIFEAAESRGRNPLYDEAVRLFAGVKPVVAAVQGAADGVHRSQARRHRARCRRDVEAASGAEGLSDFEVASDEEMLMDGLVDQALVQRHPSGDRALHAQPNGLVCRLPQL